MFMNIDWNSQLQSVMRWLQFICYLKFSNFKTTLIYCMLLFNIFSPFCYFKSNVSLFLTLSFTPYTVKIFIHPQIEHVISWNYLFSIILLIIYVLFWFINLRKISMTRFSDPQMERGCSLVVHNGSFIVGKTQSGNNLFNIHAELKWMQIVLRPF